MAKNSNLLQKTYYLNKKLDKDIIKFLNNTRNSSELIRNMLIREMRIEKGEIALIDIKNKQIIGDINIAQDSNSADGNESKENNDIKNINSTTNINQKENNNIANKEQLTNFLSCISNNKN